MHVPYELVGIRLLHILAGTIWVGGSFVSLVWFGPAIMNAGPAAAAIGETLQRRKMLQVMPLIALTSVLTGLRLLWITSDGYRIEYFRTPTGAVFGIGGAFGLVAFLFGWFVARPRAMQGKLGASYLANAMLYAAAVAMATARYLS